MNNSPERFKSNKLSVALIASILLIVTLGCNFSAGSFTETSSDEISEEANKIVREGNALVDKANQTMTKAESLSTELLGSENLKKVDDIEAYIDANKAKFDELIKLREDAAKGMEEAAAKFDQVSKMSVNDKFKEFNGVLAQQFKKLAEINTADASFDKAYLKEQDPEKHGAMFEEFNKKDAAMRKELADLQAKSAKIEKDNPDIFKK